MTLIWSFRGVVKSKLEVFTDPLQSDNTISDRRPEQVRVQNFDKCLGHGSHQIVVAEINVLFQNGPKMTRICLKNGQLSIIYFMRLSIYYLKQIYQCVIYSITM